MSVTERETSAARVCGTGAANADAFPYESAEYLQCWWASLAPKFDIPFKHGDLLIHRRRILKGLVSFKELRIAGWNNAWTQDLTAERVANFDEIDKTAGWDVFRMKWPESRAKRQAIEELRAKGYPVIQIPAPQQYVIDLSSGLEGYLQSLSHNGRKGLKKKVRRGEPLNPTLHICPAGMDADAEIEAFFEELFSHHIQYWDEKAGHSYFNDAEERHFIVQWAKVLHAKGQLRLDRMKMNDETVNLSMGVVFGDTYYWLLTINTGLHSEYGPGLIGLYMRLEQAIREGITSFNMGAGDYFYKVQSANSREICHELIVTNPRSLKGRLYHQWLSRRPAPPPADTE